MAANLVKKFNIGPTSDDVCAKVGGYKYIKDCELSEYLRRQQRSFITSTIGMLNGQALCGCSTLVDQKCFDDSCPNYKNHIMCPDACGGRCHNNLRKLKPALGTKTYLGVCDGVYGLCACRKIEDNEFIGEVTGRFRLVTEKDEKPMQYCHNLSIIGQVLDSSSVGNSARYITVSQNPNCLSKWVIDNMQYKLIIYAARDICLGECLTMNDPFLKHFNLSKNSLTASVELCPEKGSSSESYLVPVKISGMGSLVINNWCCIDDEVKDFPYLVGTSESVFRLLSTTVLMHKRPDGYIEPHQFEPLSSVFFIHQRSGQLRISGGYIVQCYRNKNRIAVYVVQSSYPWKIELHLSRWTVFKYMEDAVYALRNLYTSEELFQIFKLTTPINNAFYASEINGSFLSKFVANQKKRPRTEVYQLKSAGLFLIGSPFRELRVLASNSPSKFHLETSSCLPENQCSNVIDKLPIQDVFQRINNATLNFTGTIGNSIVISNQDNLQNPCAVNRYDSRMIFSPFDVSEQQNWRHSFTLLREEAVGMSMIHRLINHATEAITFLAGSLYTRGPANPLDWIRDNVKKCIQWHYLDNVPEDRKFLSFSDFVVVERENLNNALKCSLCGKQLLDSTSYTRETHYNKYHSLGANEWKCRQCGKIFDKPSTFWNHVQWCDQHQAKGLRCDVDFAIMDAIHEYIENCRHVSNHPTIYPLGLPTRTSSTLLTFPGSFPKIRVRRSASQLVGYNCF